MTLVTAPNGALPAGLRKRATDMLRDLARLFGDASFKEGDHPRDQDGKFGSGGGSTTGKPKLTPREKQEIDRYSGDEFLRINKELREGKASDPAVKHLDSAIGKSDLPSGQKLYRGMNREAAKSLFSGNISIGQSISDKAFASTSKSSDIGRMNSVGGVMLEITTGGGAKGLDVSAGSRNEHEQEVLLPRDAKMVVTGIRRGKTAADPVTVRVSYGSAEASDEVNEAYDLAAKPPAQRHGAAVIFVTPDRRVLLIRRSSKEENFPGYWALPGGMAEPDETPEQCAERECVEELGHCPPGGMVLLDDRVTPNGHQFRTYVQRVDGEFGCVLNDEHDEAQWCEVGSLPEKLHPAVAENLAALRRQMRQEAYDAEFNESDHPRAENGKFGSGGGSSETGPGGGKIIHHFTNPEAAKAIRAAGGKVRESDGLEGKAHYFTENKEGTKSRSGSTERLDYEVSPDTKIVELSTKEKGVGGWMRENATDDEYNHDDVAKAMRRVGVDAIRLSRSTGETWWIVGNHDKVKIINDSRAHDDVALDELPTVREVDRDGHMTVARTPITRAVVSPYLGREIAGARELGLEPDRRYMLYRDAGELEAGMATASGKPVLLRHKATSADAHPRDLTVGAIGSPVVMDGDTVYAPITLWDAEAIKGIEDGTKRGLSCGYYYKLDLTPGRAPDGTQYDGRMTNIEFNHLALVVEPRVQGAMVADDTSQLQQIGHAEPNPYGIINQEQPDMTISAAVARRTKAVTAFVAPRLAKDQSIDGLADILAFDAEREEFEAEKRAKETEDKKAKDAAEEETKKKEKEAEDKKATDAKRMEDRKMRDSKRAMDRKARDESEEGAKAFIKSKMNAEDAAKACSLMDADRKAEDDMDAEDGDDDEEAERKDKGAKDRKAMDARLGLDEATVDQKIAAARAAERGIYEARDFVRPWVGELGMSFDSADAVLAASAKSLGHDVAGVNPAGLRALIKATPRAGTQRQATHFAADSTGREAAMKLAPGLAHIHIGT